MIHFRVSLSVEKCEFARCCCIGIRSRMDSIVDKSMSHVAIVGAVVVDIGWSIPPASTRTVPHPSTTSECPYDDRWSLWRPHCAAAIT